MELNVNLGNVALVWTVEAYCGTVMRCGGWPIRWGGGVGRGGRDKCAVEQRLCGVMFLCYDSIYSGNKKNEMIIRTV